MARVNPTRLTTAIAALPKPNNMQFQFAKDWGAEELKWADLNQSLLQSLMTGAEDVSKNIVGDTMAAAVSESYGLQINKRERVLFKNLQFRTIELSWNLVPKNKEQASAYDTFIKSIKVESAPDYNTDSNQTLWDYPNTFSLEIRAKHEGSFIIFKSPDMACTNVIVNYTPRGFWAQHKDGYPVEMSFQLDFMELELATRSNIATGVIV